MAKGEWKYTVGEKPLAQLRIALKRMGGDYEFDPYLPPLTTRESRPRAVDTPGVPYPPGYWANQAAASLKHDQWLEVLGRKKKIVPREKGSGQVW